MTIDPLMSIAYWAVQASWAAAIPAVLVLAFGEWRSFPVRWRWLLSVVVALRLALPMVPAVAWHPLLWFKAEPVAKSAAVSASHTAGSSPHAVMAVWPWVWACGFAIVMVWLLVSQALLWRRITRTSREADRLTKDVAASCLRQIGLRAPVQLRVVPGLTTPAVFGLHRHWLLLPEDLEAKHSYTEVRGMLLHELQHIRSRDSWWTWAGLVLCALHWFNPLAWLCLRRFRADRELMCDARTLEMLSPRQRTAYGQALLKTWENVGRTQPALLTPFIRRNSATYHRILMSLQPTKPHRFVHLLAILLVPALSLFSLTTVKADGDAPKKPGESETTREGEGTKPGKKKKGKRSREGAPREGAAREGDGAKKAGGRDGDGARKGPRDGDKPKEGPRDGDNAGKKTGPRDGEGARTGPRDGDKPKEGARDGDQPKEGAKKEGDKQ